MADTNSTDTRGSPDAPDQFKIVEIVFAETIAALSQSVPTSVIIAGGMSALATVFGRYYNQDRERFLKAWDELAAITKEQAIQENNQRHLSQPTRGAQ